MPGSAVHVSSGQIDGTNGTVSFLTVDSGGTFFDAGTVLAGSVMGGLVVSTGAASNVTVGGGLGNDYGQDYATLVTSGGLLTVGGIDGLHGGGSYGATILSGGSLHVGSYGLASGVTLRQGGSALVSPGGALGPVTISGGTVELGYGRFVSSPMHGPVASGPASVIGALGGAVFAGGGTLIDDGPVMPDQAISGFDGTDRIFLPAVPADPSATLTVSGDIVTVSAGGASYKLDIVGAASLVLTLGVGTQSGTIDIGIACFCAGTAILTQHGERPVEAIAPGDLVRTVDGGLEEVVWVGRRAYAGRFLAGQPHLLPVRVCAGSLGGGLPRRDLCISPNHALLLDGVLIPAAALVGCPGIAVDHGCTRVEYVHLELARHSALLAEGAPAETFLDDDSRGLFHMAAGRRGGATNWYAPRVSNGPAVAAVRARLLERAAA